MSEAIELYLADGRTAGIFYCSECRIVHKTEGEAQACHGVRLCECGAPCERYRSQCHECQSKQWLEESEKKEAERFAKASKIPANEYNGGWVFSEDHDRYFDSVEALLEYIEDDGEEGETAPEYVWACKDIGVPQAHIDSIMENCLDGMWEDADGSDLNGVEELQAAVDAFNEANKSISVYQVDYKTAILIDSGKPNEKTREEGTRPSDAGD
jgi:hypothetical protein